MVGWELTGVHRVPVGANNDNVAQETPAVLLLPVFHRDFSFIHGQFLS